MAKLFAAAAAIFVAGWMVLGSAGGAKARIGCRTCGPLAPTVRVHTVYNYRTRTIHLNRSVTNYAPRYHRIIDVTRIQPVVDVHRITTTHHHTVFFRKDIHSARVERLPVMTFVTSSSRATYDCRCR